MKICEAGRSTSCCRNPDIRSINTMGADTAGNFEIRAGNSVSITTETNGIRIAYTGGITTYDNTDGNIVIDNDLFTINLADDITITGDMIIAGDLTVNGTYYTVHAEHVYTQDDYIILREGATTPLAAGSYAGFQVTKYDGTNDGRLVVDNAGVARVGDVGDEQPLLTRDEAADLTDGQLFKWDAVNLKAIGQSIDATPTDGSNAPVSSDGVYDALAGKQDKLSIQSLVDDTNIKVIRYGKMVQVTIVNYNYGGSGDHVAKSDLPSSANYVATALVNNGNAFSGTAYLTQGSGSLHISQTGNSLQYGSITYLTNDA